MTRGLSWSVAAVLLMGCPTPLTPPKPAPSSVLVAGCAAWWSDGSCELDGDLTVWISDEGSADLEPAFLDAPRNPRRAAPVEVRGGRRWVLRPPDGGVSKGLSLLRAGVEVTRIGLRPRRAQPDLSRLDLASLQAHLTEANLLDRAQILDEIRGRYRRSGDNAASVRLLEHLAAVERALGRPQHVVKALTLEAQSALAAGRFAAAQAALDRAPPLSDHDAVSQIWLDYSRARLARERGDLLQAVRRLRRMEAFAARMDQAYLRRTADQVALPLLETTGFAHLIDETEARLLEEAATLDCLPRARVLTNVAWSRLIVRQSALGESPRTTVRPSARADQTTKILNEAHQLFERCEGALSNSHLNLALDATQRGKYELAQTHLQAASRLAPEERNRRFTEIMQARLHFARGEREAAARAFDAIAAQPGNTILERWEALTGRGLAEQAMGSPSARASFEAAEAVLQRSPLQHSLLSSRQGSAAATLVSSRALVDLLAQGEDFEGAWAVARAARARLRTLKNRSIDFDALPAETQRGFDEHLARYHELRAQAARARASLWAVNEADQAAAAAAVSYQEQAAAQHLEDGLQLVLPHAKPSSDRPPQEGRLVVMLFPGQQRWWALARDAQRFFGAATSPEAPAFDLPAATALLAGLGVDFRAYEEVRFLPTSAAATIDLHASLHRGVPLGQQVAVTYGVDTEPAPAAPSPTEAPIALLLADDAPHMLAAEELDAAARHLGERGMRIVRSSGTDRSVAALIRQVAGADLMHFAGHATRSDKALRTGLRLGEELWLTAADVLSLPKSPRQVVLSGCETGRADPALAGWSLAEAFVAAGSEEVLATQRPVRGELARRVTDQMYAQTGPLAERLRGAVERLAAEDASLDWAAFRVFVP